MNRPYYTKRMIWELITELSYSQGCWGRLAREIVDAGEDGIEFLQSVEDMHFTDSLDVILFLEGN